MTRATNLEAWQASFGVEPFVVSDVMPQFILGKAFDAHDYSAKLCVSSVLLTEINFLDAQYANGFKG